MGNGLALDSFFVLIFFAERMVDRLKIEEWRSIVLTWSLRLLGRGVAAVDVQLPVDSFQGFQKGDFGFGVESGKHVLDEHKPTHRVDHAGKGPGQVDDFGRTLRFFEALDNAPGNDALHGDLFLQAGGRDLLEVSNL
jgi:hypothetical protein